MAASKNRLNGALGATTAATVGALLCFWVLGSNGWPGAPSHCKVAPCWCEAVGVGFIAEPFNTWSNLPVFCAALFIAWLASSRRPPRFATGMSPLLLGSFAYALWIEAAGALFFHAALTSWSQIFDASSVLCVWAVVIVSCLFRLRLLARELLTWAVAAGTVCAFGVRVFFTEHIETTGLICLVSTLAMEAWLVRKRTRNSGPRWFLIAALACLASSFVFWGGALPGGFLCGVGVGHALWHIAAACAVGLFALHASSDPILGSPLP